MTEQETLQHVGGVTPPGSQAVTPSPFDQPRSPPPVPDPAPPYSGHWLLNPNLVEGLNGCKMCLRIYNPPMDADVCVHFHSGQAWYSVVHQGGSHSEEKWVSDPALTVGQLREQLSFTMPKRPGKSPLLFVRALASIQSRRSRRHGEGLAGA